MVCMFTYLHTSTEAGESPSFLLTPAWAYGCWLSQSRSYQTQAPHLESFRALFHLMVTTEWGKLGAVLICSPSEVKRLKVREVKWLPCAPTAHTWPSPMERPLLSLCSSSHSPHRILLGTLDYLKEIHSGYRFCVKVLSGILPFLWACNSDMQRCVYKNVHCVIICRRKRTWK